MNVTNPSTTCWEPRVPPTPEILGPILRAAVSFSLGNHLMRATCEMPTALFSAQSTSLWIAGWGVFMLFPLAASALSQVSQ